jgi:hypothetical protein
MAISRFSTSSVAQGLPKYQKLWDGTSSVIESDFELISRTTLSSNTAYIEFASIPSTYKHLQIRGIARSDRGSTSDDLLMFLNGSTSYTNRRINNTGTTMYAEGGNDTVIHVSRNTLPGNSNPSNYFLGFVIDILDYANTTTLKTAKIYSGVDLNAGSYSGTLFAGGMNLANTNAITTIRFREETTANLLVGTSIGLYGIKGA